MRVRELREATSQLQPTATLGARDKAHPAIPRPIRSPRSGGGSRAGRDPGAAGNGLCGARRAASGHGPLHDDRLPGRLRPLRALAGPGARARLLDLAPDPRVDHAPAGRGRPGVGDRPGGHARDLRRPDRDRPRPRQARVRRRPALERGAGRLHERPRDHDHRRAAAEAVRLLDRCRHLPRRVEGVRGGPRPDAHRHARARGRGLGHPALASDLQQTPAGDPGGSRGGHRRLGGLRPRRPRGRDGRVAAPGSSHPRTPLDGRERRAGAAAGGARHHPGLADRHDRDRDQLRGPARGRGQARPGDDRCRRRERGGRLLPGVRGLDQRLADRRRRAVGGEDPAGRAGRGRAGRRSSCSSSTRCSPTCRRRRSRRW